MTGATGLIGSYLVDLVMEVSREHGIPLSVIAVGRSAQRLGQRFAHWADATNFSLQEMDLSLSIGSLVADDYILAHGNARPDLLAAFPSETLLSHSIGLSGVLRCAVDNPTSRVVVVSSSEVYGRPSDPYRRLSESDIGAVDPLLPRSIYPVAKASAEALSVAFHTQFDLDICLARPGYIYGPTYVAGDRRVVAEFIEQGLSEPGASIHVKDKTGARRSYCYVGDCASALVMLLTSGQAAEAYNIADENSEASIAEFARAVTGVVGGGVLAAEPHAPSPGAMHGPAERLLDSSKMRSLGWMPTRDLLNGIRSTIACRRR